VLSALVTASAILAASFGAAAEGRCRAMVHDALRYTVCTVEPREDTIVLRLRGADGRPFGGLGAVARALDAEGRTLRFAMNAGMYHRTGLPVGLYVEDREVAAPLVTGGGPGNFHLRPNGVFWLKDGRPHVEETRAFAAARRRPDFATQSGPMLVIDGALHPRFLADSTSAKIRNGVGVTAEGVAHFVISDDRVTFHAFARLFRDALGTPNALYFDGSISGLYAPAYGRRDDFWPAGPVVAVIAR
jgi:uncharacterized protein YigE (DUF2233 family)